LNCAVWTFDNINHLNKRSIPQTNCLTRHYTEKSLLNSFTEIICFDIHVLCKCVSLGTFAWVSWEQWCHNLGLSNRIKVDDFKKHRLSDSKSSRCGGVQFFSGVKFKFFVACNILIALSRHSNGFTERVYHRWSVTTSSQSLDSVKSWVVPTSNILF